MKVIIIGGVAGGASCAARLRRLDENAEIIMVERGPYVSYANCGLPYHVGNVIPEESKLLVALLYVADHIFFNFAMAIRTFFQKIGDPRDIAPSMAVGFTINHIGAMVFPVVGGLLWMIDYRIPFVAGAVLSLISLLAVQLITGQIRQVAEDSSQRK